MIDIETEKLISFSDAAKMLDVHRATIHRYAASGKDGVKLDVIKAPSGQMTSCEAVWRFKNGITPCAHCHGTGLKDDGSGCLCDPEQH